MLLRHLRFYQIPVADCEFGLGLNAATLRKTVSRLRQQFRHQVKAAIAPTLDDATTSADEMRALLAANVRADLEGAIGPRDALIVKPGRVSEGAGMGILGSRLWPWLAALAALLLCAEWLSFHRRWTV